MSNFNPGLPTSNLPIPQFDFLIQNWNALNTIFGTDHTLLTELDETKRGHHKFVRYYDVQPDPTLVAPQSQLYTKNVALPATIPPPGAPTDIIRALFFAEKPNTAAQNVRQLTDLLFTPFAVPGGSGRFYVAPWGWNIFVGSGGPTNFSFALPVNHTGSLFQGACCAGAPIVPLAVSLPLPNIVNINSAPAGAFVTFLIIETAT